MRGRTWTTLRSGAGKVLAAGLVWMAMEVSSAMAELTIHVAAGASGSGTPESPAGSLEAARDVARASGRLGKEPVTIRVRAGTYRLDRTLVLGAEDSGSEAAPVRWVGEGVGGAEVVVSGAMRLEVKWEAWRDGIYRAVLSEAQVAALGPEGTDQLFVGGRRQPMARFPNIVPGKNVYDAWDLGHNVKPDARADALSPERVARWSNPGGAYVHAMHDALWGDMHYRVKGKKADGTLDLEGGWQNNRPSRMHAVYRYVENVLEELDAPGEWYFDRGTRTLYFMPPVGMDLTSASVELVRLRHLVELRGSVSKPVKHVRFEGITFRQACRTFMDNREPLLRSDWTTYRGGAFFVTGAEDVAVERCTFEQLGGNAVFVSGYARRVQVRGTLLREIGGNGIAFVGSADAVRSPLFNYDQKGDFAAVDRTPGPKSPDYPEGCVVEDCLLTRTGRDEKQTAPVQISMSRGITVRHCSIYGVPRAGININEGTWGGHLVEYCDIFDTVLETGDHGSFNSWGRDRFWAPQREVVEARVAKEPGLPLLDVVEPITLRFSRWRCDHGWDIDLDDGSSNYRIYGNLLLRGGLKLREGYRRIVENNVIVNDSLHPHVWFENSGDVFRHNIVMGSYPPAGGMPTTKWGEEVDRNLFVATEAERQRFASVGCDLHSVCGGAEFLDVKAGDFRVSTDSPARQVGFTGWNFGPGEYGVRSPWLRAIARTPVIPTEIRDPEKAPANVSSPLIYHWAECAIRDFAGEEYSAYGTSRQAPGVLLTGVGKKRTELKQGDVIVELNGKPIVSMNEMVRMLREAKEEKAASEELVLTVLRNQQRMTVRLPASLGLPVL
jgi:hypothetical protein